MVAAILTIAAALVPLIVWLIRRHFSDVDSPETKFDNQKQAINSAIATKDEDKINALLDGSLDRVRHAGNSAGQHDGSETSETK